MSGIGGLPWLLALLHDRLRPPPSPSPTHLTHQTILITGSNTGVGFAAALKLVQLNAARVILAVRSIEKGEDAKAKIERVTGREGVVEVWECDMGDYGSLRGFVERMEREVEGLGVVVLNAGVARMGFERAAYGWEGTLQINTISTALLAILLLPKLRASATSSYTPVLELVSSSNHTQVAISPTARTAPSPLEIYNDPSTYNPIIQYSISKLFLQFIQTGLVKHLGPVETAKAEIVTVCPGATKSDIARGEFPWPLRVAQKLFYYVFMKPTEQGARTYVGGVCLEGKGHGAFYRWGRVDAPAPTLVGPENEKLQEKVWEDVLRILRKDVPEVDAILSSVAAVSTSGQI